jgi:hypothetical protein
MAARVVTAQGTGGAGAGASINTVDISDVTGLLPVQGLPVGLGSVGTIAGSLLGNVQAAPGFVLGTAGTLAGDALCIPTGVVGTALGTSLDAVANLHVGLGSLGAGAGVAGLLNVPFGVVGTVQDCVGDLAGDALGTVNAVQATAAPIVTTGLGVVTGVATTATGVPGMVLGLPGQLMGLGDLLNVTAGGNANLGAALVGIL